MPTYEYECTSCKHRFETFQSMMDDPLDECPECGKKIRRLIGGGMGIIFKGSGFYSTDNRSGSNGSKGANGESASSENKKPESSKSSGGSSGTNKGDSSSSAAAKKEPAKTKK